MTSKEKIEALNYIWFYEPSCQEEADKREAIIKELKQDLDRLEQIDNAKPSEALEILETFNGGLLNKEIGAISYNQIWLENQIKALKQALLKAQEQDKILKLLRQYESVSYVKECGRYKIIIASEKIKEKEHNALKEWLVNDK